MERVASARLLPVQRSDSLPQLAKWGGQRSPPARRRSAQATRAMIFAFTALVCFHLTASLLSYYPPPMEELPAVAWGDLAIDGDDLAVEASATAAPGLPEGVDRLTGPRLIPRIIHQLYNSSEPEAAIPQAAYRAWKRANPGWELRFYDAAEGAIYVARWFPQYERAYRGLRTEAEQRDLFRYLTVLLHGGLFADVGAQVVRPLDEVMRPEDAMVVGWDAEFPSGQAAVEACYIRARQVQHRVFAAAAGHPVLRTAVERIAATLDTRFSLHPTLDALERTGPGVFTDAVLQHAEANPPALRGSTSGAGKDGTQSWPVRLLPRSALGSPQPPSCAVSPDPSGPGKGGAAGGYRRAGTGVRGRSAPRQGSRRLTRWWWALWPWKNSGDGGSGENAEDGGEPWGFSDRPDVAVATHLERLEALHPERQLFPVSADFEPPFDVMTHLVSHGERQSGWDVSLALSTYGSWQPSVQPTRRPTLAEAVVGSLGKISGKAVFLNANSSSSSSNGDGGVLIDVGAGYGLISLAAAARGHRVHAFELGPGSLEALEAGVQRNGFEHLVQVHKAPLGAPQQRGAACLELKAGATMKGRGGAPAALAALPPNVELARGYSDPAAHAADPADCVRSALRLPGSDLIPAGDRVAALRVSASGWEGFVLEGFLPLIERQRPPVIAVEWSPEAMQAVGYASPLDLLRMLSSLGYDDVSHSGYICDERWYAITYGVRRQGRERPEDQAGLRQPTWCRLLPEDGALLLEKANSKYPETLLFVNRNAGKQQQQPAAAGPASSFPSSGGGGGGGGQKEEAPGNGGASAAAAVGKTQQQQQQLKGGGKQAVAQAVSNLAATGKVSALASQPQRVKTD